MTQELYKKYRPNVLKSVIGNKTTVQTLKNMIARKKVPHTILLQGPSGCGKTTIARILQKELNCCDIDFKELNCSSKRGVDTIREIERTMSMAATGGMNRIWLMDEVHMLTKEAMNAALKIWEDTPSHVYFILCTTEPQAILSTIKTRCCQLDVELLNSEKLTKLIRRVCHYEQKKIEEDLIIDIIDASEGSGRKALVILDRILNLPPESRAASIKIGDGEKGVIDLCRGLMKGMSWSKISNILKELQTEPESVRYAVLGYARSCLLGAKNNQAALIIDVFSENFYDSKNAGLALACYEIIVGIE